MAKLFNDVNRGDLITADLWNQVLDTLNTFDARLTALEAAGTGGGALTITGIYPPSALHVGDTISILGKNFGLPSSNAVTIDGTSAGAPLAGSNDTQLIIKIPNLQGIPASGKFVTLTVGNPNGFATITFTVLPAQSVTPTGQLFVNMSSTPVSPADATIAAGKSYIFTFAVTAITSMDETYTVSPVPGQASWQAVAVDDQGNTLSPQEVLIPQGDPPNGVQKDVRVMVTIPGGQAIGTSSTLALTVTSKRNAALTAFGNTPSPIVVGSPPPGGQDQIILSFNKVFAPGSQSGNSIKVPPTNAQVRVDFTAILKNPGTYTVANPTVQNDPNNLWKAQLMSSKTMKPTTSNSNNLITIALSAQPGAPSANLVISVTSAGSPAVTAQFTQPILAGA